MHLPFFSCSLSLSFFISFITQHCNITITIDFLLLDKSSLSYLRMRQADSHDLVTREVKISRSEDGFHSPPAREVKLPELRGTSRYFEVGSTTFWPMRLKFPDIGIIKDKFHNCKPKLADVDKYCQSFNKNCIYNTKNTKSQMPEKRNPLLLYLFYKINIKS